MTFCSMTLEKLTQTYMLECCMMNLEESFGSLQMIVSTFLSHLGVSNIVIASRSMWSIIEKVFSFVDQYLSSIEVHI